MRLRLAVRRYEPKLGRGAHSLREHPASAPSWGEESAQRLPELPGVLSGVGHLCRLGMRAEAPKSDGDPQLARKPA
eukprot:10854623-Alexandrium_andersonii.AAC.1